ncbi:MAG: RNA methyltransferase [Cyclobacteriaceae bacterium]|nr:RNA methyltransferase [Cyclobacteriaceae bacterium]
MPLTNQEQLLLEHFAQYISDHKKQFTEKVLAARTRQVTVVLEDIYQSQNASAALRTCECMGIQDIHIIENTTKYEVNKYVLKGSYKWLSLNRYKQKRINNTEACFRKLKENGYTLYATAPGDDNMSVYDVDPCTTKAAFIFGNELNGLSAYALAHADHRIKIPMYGFTESLNISASVAICLSAAIERLKHEQEKFGLSVEEKDRLRLDWYRKMVKRSEIIEKEFLRTNP